MARKALWLIRRLNSQFRMGWKFLGYIDEHVPKGTGIGGYPVLGNMDYLRSAEKPLAVACAMGSPQVRKAMISQLENNENLTFPNLIDPKTTVSIRSVIGKGNIICLGSVLSADVVLGDFNIINFNCNIGKAAHLGSFTTLHSNVWAGDHTLIGTGAQIGRGTMIRAGRIIKSFSHIQPESVIDSNRSSISIAPDTVVEINNPLE